MKILFDTNIYFSAAAFGGQAAEAVRAVHFSPWRTIVSRYVMDELYRTLLERTPLRRNAIGSYCALQLKRASKIVESVESRHAVLSDSADSPILRAALAGSADYLVSSDRHLLSLDPYESLRIVSLRTFRQILIDDGLLTSSSS